MSDANIQRSVCMLTWDAWVGSSQPAGKVFYAVQDFHSIAKKAVSGIVAVLEGEKLKSKKTQVPCLEIKQHM